MQNFMSSKFTKKHYIVIAKVLKESKTREDILSGLCSEFMQDNQNFDMRKFCLASLQEKEV